MKIEVRKCGFSGQLFEKPQDYLKHLRKLRQQQRKGREYARTVQTWEGTIAQLTTSCTTPQELESWINCNLNQILAAGVHQGRVCKQRRSVKLRFEFQNMRHHAFVSNSHGAPRGEVKNWNRQRDKPLGYPGWQGYMIIHGWERFDGFSTNVLNVMPIHTGSGSCGNYSVYWFDADWPGMVLYQSIIR